LNRERRKRRERNGLGRFNLDEEVLSVGGRGIERAPSEQREL